MDENITDITTTLVDNLRNREPNSARQLISSFLIARSGTFRGLTELRDQGWSNPQGDKHFKKQRQVADEQSKTDRRVFYNLMRQIGDEIQDVTGALSLSQSHKEVFDICMAPGGYSASALKYSPHARVSGLTLPHSLGGHRLLINDSRVDVQYADITMLAAEYGVTDIPKDHPDVSNFSLDRPWATKLFDLVFCDGQVLRTHTSRIASYREQCEARRLACSQLILAMQRIRPGGTLIMLLHRVEMWDTMKLLSIFDKISQIELLKPIRSHKTRSSFYLIAKNVQPDQPEALVAINEWRESWKNATFPQSADEGIHDRTDFVEQDEEVSRLLASFGERLIELGGPVWEIQKNALREAPWLKTKEVKSAGTSAKQMGVPASSGSADPTDASSQVGNLQIGER